MANYSSFSHQNRSGEGTYAKDDVGVVFVQQLPDLVADFLNTETFLNELTCSRYGSNTFKQYFCNSL